MHSSLGKITITAVDRLEVGETLNDSELIGFSVRRQRGGPFYSVRGRLRGQRIQEGRWSPFALAAIRLLLFTGCRRNEIRLLHWSDVDIARELLNLRNTKGGPRVVHLNAGAIAVLEKLRAFPDDGNPYVIRGIKDGEPFKNLQDVWDVVRDFAKLPEVRLHDLRHSVASFAGADGASLPLIGAVLGQSSVQATKRYTHLAGDPAKRVIDRVGATIERELDVD